MTFITLFSPRILAVQFVTKSKDPIQLETYSLSRVWITMDKSAEEPTKKDLPKSEAKVLREIALLLDTGINEEDLQDIQNACVAGVSPYEIAQEIRRGRARSF